MATTTAAARKQPSIAECEPTVLLSLTPGDAMFIRPGTLFEMSPEVINGREYRVWKNVSPPACRPTDGRDGAWCARTSSTG
jgi:hypothetical protein